MNEYPLSDTGSSDNDVRLHEGEWRGEEKEHWCSGDGHVEGMLCEHNADMIEGEHWSCCGSLEFDGPCGVPNETIRSSTPISHESDEMLMYIFETERWFPIVGWGQKRLPTDIPEWHDTKRKSVDRRQIRLPAGCIWASSWSIDSSRGDNEGWEYSGNWRWKYHHTRRKTDMVRRRRWKRSYHREKEIDITLHRSREGEPLGATFKDRILIKGEGVAESLSDFLGWRLSSVDDGPVIEDDTQIAEAIRNKISLKITLQAIPTPELHFLPDHPYHSHRCFTISKGRKQHGSFFMSVSHASFVTNPFKSFILFQWKHCIKVDKQMAWKGQSIKFTIRDDSGERKEYLFEGFDAKDNVYGNVKDLAGPVCGRGRTASRSSAASFDESGSEYDGNSRVFHTHSSTNKHSSVPSETPGSPSTPLVTSPEISVAEMNGLFSRLPQHVSKYFLSESHITHVTHDTVVIPGTSINDVFNVLFANDSKFLSSYHTKRGEYQGTKEKPTPCVIPHWEQLTPDTGYRSFECTTIVQAPWNKHTRFVEWQRYAKSDKKLLVHFTSQTPDVMTGDCFRIEVLVDVTQGKGSCDLRILSEIHFLKSTWIRSKIQSTAIGELVVTYRQFVAQAREALGGKRLSSRSSNSFSGEKKKTDSPPESAITQANPIPVKNLNLSGMLPSSSVVFDIIQRLISGISNFGILNGIAVILLLYSLACVWAVVTSVTTAIQGYSDLSGALSTAARCSSDPLCNRTTAGENLLRLLEASGGTQASLSLTFNTISLAVANVELVVLLIFSLFLTGAIAFLLHSVLGQRTPGS